MNSSTFETAINTAHEYARVGRNDDFLQASQALANASIQDAKALTKVASLLLSFGFSSQAKKCLDRAVLLDADSKEALMALLLCHLQLGEVEAYQETAKKLLTHHPNDLKVLSHILHFSAYLNFQSNEDQLAAANQWGECAIQLAGGTRARPAFKERVNQPLRLGYVSADFCQHTVGILIKEVLKHHNQSQFKVFCYSAGNTRDWITEEIASNSTFVDVSHLGDADLAQRVIDDEIDILVDLSGHTGGSRLSAFAYRPAPILVSMLGYYATTGLKYLDAFLLDDWHIQNNTQNQFVEPIVSLPSTRWCYYPAFPAPSPASSPAIKNGYITFASFNNTLKYNARVFILWAQILKEVPHSRLILKWRTLNDPVLQKKILGQFKAEGIDSSRIELRGPSFHLQMLDEYKDVDIALDPFPFSGGVTSCEALYMGVPVITWPQDQVVSRQTLAFISLVGYPELVAKNHDDYISIAKTLSSSPERLKIYREELRMKMITSSLMNVAQYCTALEKALFDLYQNTLLKKI